MRPLSCTTCSRRRPAGGCGRTNTSLNRTQHAIYAIGRHGRGRRPGLHLRLFRYSLILRRISPRFHHGRVAVEAVAQRVAHVSTDELCATLSRDRPLLSAHAAGPESIAHPPWRARSASLRRRPDIHRHKLNPARSTAIDALCRRRASHSGARRRRHGRLPGMHATSSPPFRTPTPRSANSDPMDTRMPAAAQLGTGGRRCPESPLSDL